jgi:hypothetical protein
MENMNIRITQTTNFSIDIDKYREERGGFMKAIKDGLVKNVEIFDITIQIEKDGEWYDLDSDEADIIAQEATSSLKAEAGV